MLKAQDIFYDACDREFFNSLVKEGVKRYEHKIYAYCLMSNHVHFAIEVNNVSLSKIIQNLAFRYTRYFNKKLRRIGHLFQGRYKSILVQKDAYLLELIRYIHLNPVRAKIVGKPQEYQWSSHHCYMRTEKLSWIITHEVLSFFSNNKASAVRRYKNFINEGLNEILINFEKEQFTNINNIIGEEDFIEKNESKDKKNELRFPIELIIDMACNILSVTKKNLKQKTRRREVSFARHIVAFVNKQHGEISNSDLAFLFDLDPSTLSKATNKIETERDLNFTSKVEEVIQACQKSISQA
jgi:putative transposase